MQVGYWRQAGANLLLREFSHMQLALVEVFMFSVRERVERGKTRGGDCFKTGPFQGCAGIAANKSLAGAADISGNGICLLLSGSG